MLKRFLVVTLFVASSVALTWQVVNFTRDWTLQHLQQQGSDELLQVISQLRSALDGYRYLPFLLSQDRNVKALTQTPVPDVGEAVSLYLEQTNLVAGSSSLFVLGQSGHVLAYSHWRDEQDFFLRSHQDQQYFELAKAGHRGRQFSLNRATGTPAYYLSSPIYNGTLFSGVAVVRIELPRLVSKLRSTGTVLLSDQQDVLFYSNGPFDTYGMLNELAEAQGLTLGNGVTTQLWHKDQQHWLVSTVMLDDLSWRVTVLSNTDSVERNVRNAALFSFGGCLALGLLGLFYRERHLKLRSQEETRQALARSEAQQKAIINHAQVGLLLIDVQGNIRFANEMALQQFIVSMTLIMQKPMIELLAFEGGDSPVHRCLQRLGQRGFAPLIGYEAVGVRGDGTEFPLMLSIRKMQVSGRTPREELHARQFLVTVIDISRRKGLELQLQRANESLEHKVEERTQALQTAQQELVQAGKMAVLGRMSTAIVHELNQPLTAIRNYVAICRQLLDQPQMLAESLQEVDSLTQRMARITTQLKTYAYKKPEQKEPVSMQMVITHALQLFKQRIAVEQVQVLTELPDETCYVLGDSARLEQVLVNLIKNALDAMAGQEDQRLTLSMQQGARLSLSVSDSGPGLDPELIDHLFDPFVTSKPIGDGLGLGLAIVKSILRDLDGDISVGSTPAGGACFTLSLPLAASRQSQNELS